MLRMDEMLARRSDLSTFVVHLTRDTDTGTARENLHAILREHCLRAVTAMGLAAREFEPGSLGWKSQRVVAFTESPLEHLHTFLVPLVEKRRNQFQPYGLAFNKKQARDKGINPVWYVDSTSWAATDSPTRAIKRLLRQAKDAGDFASSPMARVAPFVETMGSTGSWRKEFSWEREWRHLGDLHFAPPNVALGLCPEDEIDSFYGQVPFLRFIDPRWGMEQIISSLATTNRQMILFTGDGPAT